MPCFTVFLLEVLSIIFRSGSIELFFKIISLYNAQSPAILPNAQMAYSAISGCGDYKRLQNKGIAPLSYKKYFKK